MYFSFLPKAEDSFVLPSSTPLRALTKVRERLAHKIAKVDKPVVQKQPSGTLIAPPSSPSKVKFKLLFILTMKSFMCLTLSPYIQLHLQVPGMGVPIIEP